MFYNAIGHLLERHRNKLKQIELQISTLDPARMLKYGYSITRLNGHAVTDPKALKPGDCIETTLEKGKIKSTIK